MGGDKGGGTEVTQIDTTPQWIKDLGTSSAAGFNSGQSALQNTQNPYGDYNSLFSNTTGQSYLDAFSSAPKAAYDQALSDTKDLFGANGLYGSVGNDMMSGAMASAGSQYANAMSNAQIAAQQAQLNDYNASAQQGLFDYQKQQQVINNYLSSLGMTINPTMAGQQTIVEEDEGKGGGLLGGIGSLAGAAFGMF